MDLLVKTRRKAITAFGAGALGLLFVFQDTTPRRSSLRSTALASQPTLCKFRAYVPSAWEGKWEADIDTMYSQDSICPAMQQSSGMAKLWLAGVSSCKQNGASCGDNLSTQVFSKFVKTCLPSSATGLRGSGGGRALSPMVVVEEFIEPLVGHMRHPYALSKCTPPDIPAVDVQDRSYLLMLGDGIKAVRARHPGRAILVDAGTNKFESSLGYLLPTYAALGIHFDAIYAWEAQPADPSEYWASVPADVKPRLHFYNAPVTPEPGSSMNPVDWIRNMYRPGDFIVFKLDIDNDNVESALIQQVLDMDGAEDIIGEMYFEKHYTATDMKPYFGTPDTKYPAAVRLMQALRKKGVRVHYWP